jgi:hypothetical protein
MVAGSQSGSTTELREDLGDLKWVRLGPHVKPKDLGDPEGNDLGTPSRVPSTFYVCPGIHPSPSLPGTWSRYTYMLIAPKLAQPSGSWHSPFCAAPG